MMQPEVRCRMTLAYANTDTTPIVVRLVKINEINLQKLFILKSLQNMEHGQSTLKQGYQVGHSRWILLLPQKKKPLEPVREMGAINHVKLRLGFEMAV